MSHELGLTGLGGQLAEFAIAITTSICEYMEQLNNYYFKLEV